MFAPMNPTGHARAETRVGTLILRHAPPPEGDAPYRRRPDGPLEIERTRSEVPRPRPGVISALVAVLGLGLLVFAAYVRSGPAIGAVSFALVALAWLVLRSRVAVDRVERIRLAGEQLHVESGDEPMTVAVSDVARVDLGLDTASLRTVWAAVAGRGRVMLLDGLTEEEANAMIDALRDRLDRADVAPSPARVEIEERPAQPVDATDEEGARVARLAGRS